MQRADADAFYLFDDAYWSALADGVPMVSVEVWQGSEQLAGVVGLTGAPWLHYHLGASSDSGRSLGASHLALYELARWGQEQGYSHLHLGGGVGGRRDSLFLYKERFAPGGEIPAAIGKAVHDPARYRELTGQAERRSRGSSRPTGPHADPGQPRRRRPRSDSGRKRRSSAKRSSRPRSCTTRRRTKLT